MYKFKLKEIEVGDTDTKGGKKSTVTDVNPETGAITWDVKDVADFTSTYKELEKAKDFLSKLEKTGKSKDDPAIDKLAAEIQELFNTFRTHIRKNYPEEYKRVLRLKESVNEEYSDLDLYYRKGYKDFTGLVNRIVEEKDLEEKRKLMHVYVDILPKASREKKFKLKQSINKMGPNQIDKFAYNLLMRDSRMTSLQNESVNENALQGPETKDVYEVGDTVIYRKGNVAHSGTVELRTKDFDYYVTDDSDGKGYLVKMDDVIGLNLEEGEGIGYLTPRAFAKNKKSKGAADIYYYKLGYKPVPKIKPKGFEVKQLWEYSDFQQKRINVFDEIEEKLNSISPLLSNAKNETAEYYNENPGSYAIVYSTDMANELLDDIIKLLKQSE